MSCIHLHASISMHPTFQGHTACMTRASGKALRNKGHSDLGSSLTACRLGSGGGGGASTTVCAAAASVCAVLASAGAVPVCAGTCCAVDGSTAADACAAGAAAAVPACAGREGILLILASLASRMLSVVCSQPKREDTKDMSKYVSTTNKMNTPPMCPPRAHCSTLHHLSNSSSVSSFSMARAPTVLPRCGACWSRLAAACGHIVWRSGSRTAWLIQQTDSPVLLLPCSLQG